MPKPEYCDSKTRIGSLITGAIEIVYFLSSLFTDYPWPLKRFCVKSQMVSFGDTHSYQFTNAELFVSFERMETLRIRASKERTAGQKNLTWNMKAVVSPGGTLPIMAQHEIDKKTSCFSDLFPRRAFLSRFMKWVLFSKGRYTFSLSRNKKINQKLSSAKGYEIVMS